jgi:hypothetical protein
MSRDHTLMRCSIIMLLSYVLTDVLLLHLGEELFPTQVAQTFSSLFAGGDGEAGAIQLHAAEIFGAPGVGPDGDAAQGQFHGFVEFEVALALESMGSFKLGALYNSHLVNLLGLVDVRCRRSSGASAAAIKLSKSNALNQSPW